MISETSKAKSLEKTDKTASKMVRLQISITDQLDDIKTREYRSYSEVVELLLEHYNKGK